MHTYWEEHKKQPSSLVNFARFSKKCLERRKTVSAKENSNFEHLAKSDKAGYDKEMKNYIPPNGDEKEKRKKKKILLLPKDHHLLPSGFALDIVQGSKLSTQTCLLEMLQRNWVRCGLKNVPKISNCMSRKQLN